MTSPATGVDWAAAGLTPEMSDQIFKTAQGAWTNSPAGRRYEMMRSIMPTLVSVQGQKDVIKMKEEMAQGNLDKAVAAGQSLALPTDLQTTLGVKSFGSLVGQVRDVDTAQKILNAGISLINSKNHALYLGSESALRESEKQERLYLSYNEALNKMARDYILPHEVAEISAKHGEDKKKIAEELSALSKVTGKTVMTQGDVDRYNYIIKRLNAMAQGKPSDFDVTLEELEQQAGADKEAPPPPPQEKEVWQGPLLPPEMRAGDLVGQRAVLNAWTPDVEPSWKFKDIVPNALIPGQMDPYKRY